MVVMRRMFTRMLRIRNLFTMTVFIILLYIFKFYCSSTSNIFTMDYFRWDKKIFVPASLKKIDWHNYTQIKIDRERNGVGEHGIAAFLSKEDLELEKKLYDVNGFNGYLSDKIALDRSLPDIRHPGCEDRKYIESLPCASVVVPFHNEHWSTLLRTAVSVLSRSPQHLIKEIFLVDDASTKEFLKKELDDYVTEHFTNVKVVRLPKRSGLITARLAGAAQATGDVLIFLDSHTEVNVNWLPPLLEPIALNYRTVVCPFIDVIAYDTFEYRAQDEGARGAFDWEFFYKRLPVLPKDEQNMPEPFESPVMAGGLFAISRAFFNELGAYDPGLDIWGGEQYELSFKIWQCGGRMLDAPCSRVGHIYRKFAPFPNPNHGDFVGKNYRRVAEVWMDDYAKYLYMRRPHYLQIDPGDLTERRAIRDQLRCKPFEWFMREVAFDLTYMYPTIEPDPYANGKIKPLWNPSLCVDAKQGEQNAPLALTACKSDNLEGEFVFTWHKDIKLRNRNMCWDLPDTRPQSKVLLYSCHRSGGNQLWRYDLSSKQIQHGDSCLDYDRDNMELYVSSCDAQAPTQQWKIDHINFERMELWYEKSPRPTGPVRT